MHANLKGALAHLNKCWRAFSHKGNPMTKSQLKAVLEYGIAQGYESTDQLTDAEIDHVLRTLTKRKG